MALIIFHVEDAYGQPLGDVLGSSVGGPGPWQAVTNPCGDMKTDLAPAHYEITFSKAGYETLTLPADLAECGVVTVGLQQQTTAPPSVLPPIPTRAHVCALQTTMAGITYHTTQWGAIPAWFYGALNTQDRQIARDAHRDAGDTHIILPITEAYRESGTLWPEELRNGYDYTDDLTTYRRLATELIADGFLIDCPLGGDGLGDGPGYNDPIGRTYGHGWIMQNLARIITALQGDGTAAAPDLTQYIIFRPGWDAVFFGWSGAEASAFLAEWVHWGLRWKYVRQATTLSYKQTLSTAQLDDQQTRIRDFGELFRRVHPTGYLSIQHTPGDIPVGLGPADYAPGGMMQHFDTILSEFNSVHEDSCWQIVGRMVSPYHRPPEQPAGDDPNPPFYLAPGTPRGPYFYVAFEPTKGGLYEYCRGACTLADVITTRTYLRNLGCLYTG